MDNINNTQLPLNIISQVVGSSVSQSGLPVQLHSQSGLPVQLHSQSGLSVQLHSQSGLPVQLHSQSGLPVQLHLVNAIPASIDPNMGQHFISTTAVSGLEAALSQHFISSLGQTITNEIGQHFLISSGTPIDINQQFAQQIMSVMEVKSEGTLHSLIGMNQSTYTNAEQYGSNAGICTDISQALIESTSSGARTVSTPVSGAQCGRVMDSKLDLLNVENLLRDSQRYRSVELDISSPSNEELFIDSEQVLPHVSQEILTSTSSLDDFTKLSSVPVDSSALISSVVDVNSSVPDVNMDKKDGSDDEDDDDEYDDDAENSTKNDDTITSDKSDDDIDDDCKSELLSISDKIRLLKKELGTVRRKRSKLLKEVEKMSARELELQKQLEDQTLKRNGIRGQKSAVTVKSLVPKGQSVSVVTSSTPTSSATLSTKTYPLSGMTTRSGRRIKREPLEVISRELSSMPGVLIESIHDSTDAVIELPDITTVKAEITEAEMLTDVKLENEIFEPTAGRRKKRAKGRPVADADAPTVKRAKREKREIKCDKCQKEFKRSHNLNKHRQTCVDLSNLSDLPDADQDFSQLPAVHPQIFTCEQCDKRFTTKYALILHQRMHAGDFRNLCSVCGKGFVNITALKRHMDYHVRRFNCDVCGRHFSRLRELKMHQRRHTGERPYMCPYCGKSYPTASHLRYHMPFHNEVKAYTCSICQKGFHHSKAFHNHYLQHSGEKPYTCLLCPQRFSSRYRLMKHQAVDHDSDSSKLSCETCGKMFLTVGNLKSHRRSHSNDRPHKCDRCDKQYKNIYDLVIHKKKKHESAFPSVQF